MEAQKTCIPGDVVTVPGGNEKVKYMKYALLLLYIDVHFCLGEPVKHVL